MNRERRVEGKASSMKGLRVIKDAAMKPLFDESLILQVTAQSKK